MALEHHSNIWEFLVNEGYISGNPDYYALGQAQPFEYENAIRVAIAAANNSDRPDIARRDLFSALHQVGAFQGDANAFITGRFSTGHTVQPVDIDNLVSASVAFFSRNPSGTPGPTPPQSAPPSPIAPTPLPQPVEPPVPPLPTPAPGDPFDPTDPSTPEPSTPIDFEARARLLYPWLPQDLLRVYADSWAETGDPALALATVRQHPSYDQHFPGIKRSDGSLRMSESEWFSTREAYSTLIREYGLNDSLFSGRFDQLMENDVSPAELAQRLGAAYSQIVSNIPAVRQAYAAWFGDGMTDAAIFASFIDADVADDILNERIAISQVAAEGLSRGFDFGQGFATELTRGGLNQSTARQFFIEADNQLTTLDTLVRRHRDPDDDFDLNEFAQSQVFGDPTQRRRIQRVLAAETASFTDRLGTRALDEDLRVGLSPR